MNVNDVLIEAYGRIPDLVREAVEDLTPEQLHRAPAPGANTIAWLVWHLTRIQDHHIAEVAERPQVWVGDGWAKRFGLEPDPNNHGYGHGPEQVAAVRAESWQALVEYHEAVWSGTREYLSGLTAEDLDRIVDRRWDPPVTLGVRLVSVVDDEAQHVGQAAYLRGLLG